MNDENINNGWDFLNSGGNNESYYGDDGSWGYKNADGSASFYGADGSWGYKNADGNTSYYGADGSWGYKNADGSGSYYGSNNNSIYYDAETPTNDNDESYANTSSSMDSLAGLAGIALGLGLTTYSKYKQAKIEQETKAKELRLKEKKIRLEQKRGLQIQKEQRKKEAKIKKKRLIALLFRNKKIKIGVSTNFLVGKTIDYVVKRLEKTGFNNITTIPIKDVYINSEKAIGEVEQVVINGKSLFDEKDMMKYDSEIIITYHLKKEITMPVSSRQLCKTFYNEAVQQLFKMGFTEIYTRPEKDLITGWITRNGSIKRILVGDKKRFKKGSVFEYDIKIVISYHSFKNQKKLQSNYK